MMKTKEFEIKKVRKQYKVFSKGTFLFSTNSQWTAIKIIARMEV